MSLSVIVLAAGAGTRMRSDLPKPLHPICGRPMLLHVVHALDGVRPDRTVIVVGHGADTVRSTVLAQAPTWANVTFAIQENQNGTGDATSAGLTAIAPAELGETSTIVVTAGDTPLISAATITELVTAHRDNENAATVLTSVLDDPTGYGRIVRAPDGRVLRIVEQRDASPDELDIREWNTGIYAFRGDLLGPALAGLDTGNSQGEYYLTDVIARLAADGRRVGAVRVDAAETLGVNDRSQLAEADAAMRARINHRWMLAGVSMTDPARTCIDVTATLGRDTVLHPDTMVLGSTAIGSGCVVGPGTTLEDCTVGDGAVVERTTARSATVGDGATVGPYANLAPGASVAAAARTGAFYTA
ncbi:MAG: putative bifunctional protein GlmU [Actinomycetota bacterium]|jgi:bifunctional UDP-N-acetylglucosamine pyrophosphorylase/glucosamine-1-phosphate N-acetyltransferase